MTIIGWIMHPAFPGYSEMWELINENHEHLASIDINGAGEYVAGVHFWHEGKWIFHGQNFTDIGTAQNWARGIVDDVYAGQY